MAKRPNPEQSADFLSQDIYNGSVFETKSMASLGIYRRRRTYTSAYTPNFLEKKRKNQLPENLHTMKIERYFGTGLSRYFANSSSSFYETWTYCAHRNNIAFPAISHVGEAYAKARSRVADKAAGLRMNVAQAFAERGQTANLLADTATRVLRAARALKHLRFQELLHALSSSTFDSNRIRKRKGGYSLDPNGGLISDRNWQKRVASTPIEKRIATHWLEIQYGWKPLLNDCYEAAEILADHCENDLYHHRVTGSGSAFSTVTLDYGSGPCRYVVESKKTRAKLVCSYRLDSAARANLAQTGISNPMLLAWELLPYSFVVDWFLPVGNYLESLTAFDGFDLVSGVQSQVTNQEITRNFGLTNVNTSSVKDIWTGNDSKLVCLLERVPLVSFPPAVPPSFKNPLGGAPIARLATALALLRVLFK